MKLSANTMGEQLSSTPATVNTTTEKPDDVRYLPMMPTTVPGHCEVSGARVYPSNSTGSSSSRASMISKPTPGGHAHRRSSGATTHPMFTLGELEECGSGSGSSSELDSASSSATTTTTDAVARAGVPTGSDSSLASVLAHCGGGCASIPGLDTRPYSDGGTAHEYNTQRQSDVVIAVAPSPALAPAGTQQDALKLSAQLTMGPQRRKSAATHADGTTEAVSELSHHAASAGADFAPTAVAPITAASVACRGCGAVSTTPGLRGNSQQPGGGDNTSTTSQANNSFRTCVCHSLPTLRRAQYDDAGAGASPTRNSFRRASESAVMDKLQGGADNRRVRFSEYGNRVYPTYSVQAYDRRWCDSYGVTRKEKAKIKVELDALRCV